MGIVASLVREWRGGVHPPGHKELTARLPIETIPMPERLYVPLLQHSGRQGEECVRADQLVKKGEMIVKAQGFISTPVHAPTSGRVVAVAECPVGHPSGLTMPCVIIEPDGRDEWLPTLQGLPDPLNGDPALIRKRVQDCGVVGLGGAVFPAHAKISPRANKKAEMLLINGAECEPYLSGDARLMEERPQEIVGGIEFMLYSLGVDRCVIGIEDNKPFAIRAMQEAIAGRPQWRVAVLPVKYPQGAKKQMIEAVTHRQVPPNGSSLDVGVVIHNVGTAAAIYQAVALGRPLITRVLSVSGLGVVQPKNLEVLIGTPLHCLFAACGGLKPGVRKVVMGGSMMGMAVNSLEVPVVKAVTGLLALTDQEVTIAPEQPCIRCGRCLEACPMGLMPTEMAWLSRNDQWDRLKEHHLEDCMECGSCGYVCPSHLPLVQYFRYGKAAIWGKRQEKKRLDLDKERIKRKQERVAKEEALKEQKKAQMKAQMMARKKEQAAAPSEA